ncbi:hypothetical protein BGY98DRAFT_1163918 [Russula aff. rugulosa BPL654]|nr:hypothetical protein BGY98DRAFT_1163918 [Russula aff. rugulosa BPL654]
MYERRATWSDSQCEVQERERAVKKSEQCEVQERERAVKKSEQCEVQERESAVKKSESEMKGCEIPKRGLLQLQEGERGKEGSKVEGSEIGAQRARKREKEEKKKKKMELLAKKKNNELQQKGERVLQETETSHVICQVLRACLRGHTGVSVQFL